MWASSVNALRRVVENEMTETVQILARTTGAGGQAVTYVPGPTVAARVTMKTAEMPSATAGGRPIEVARFTMFLKLVSTTGEAYVVRELDRVRYRGLDYDVQVVRDPVTNMVRRQLELVAVR